MKTMIFAAALALGASSALAADKYVLDSSHSQVLFSYNHLGYSTTYGMFSGFEGEIMFVPGSLEQPEGDEFGVTVSRFPLVCDAEDFVL